MNTSVMECLQKDESALCEALDNIAMSCQMEGMELTSEIRALCLAVLDGTLSLQDGLYRLNMKYS
ncbi:Uncharacterised protein [uncultured Butyricicoccus sp.]|uniref:Uncharacterized protein n=1 Tax=Agathobaculum ammoniilyticum TaxID=2981778 RepID=A0ABT2U6A3_9FIRM|nr:hypothetical protein [Agathobaculum ammoniilyticum]MBS6884276.1 hypothetical protein [Clostridiaceae bacterium]MCU6790155.1 hypothetical protein [Agathobaculum ammoniilyticum]SCJ52307.1 Uncharacterised protein [uncultured Butyricicoccus sp.]